MVGWHHHLDGNEFDQAPGVGDGQGILACCSPWGHRGSDTAEHERAFYALFKKCLFMFIHSVYGLPGRLSSKVSSPGKGNGSPLHILAWETPWTKEPGGLQSTGLHRVGQDLAVLFSCSVMSNSLRSYGL